MNHKVQETIAKHAMLVGKRRVFVALSGGADSVALLHLLWRKSRRGNFELFALHVNHNLRGRESDRDERFVRALCQRLRVPLFVRSAQVAQLAKRRGVSVEESARQVRYDFFARYAQLNGACVATAHTASDNAETVLINLVRGTGLRGLCGIPPVRGGFVRPLIGCTRGEVETYCARNRLTYVTDSSNHSDLYTRNSIRHHVMPLLRRYNTRLEEQMGEMASILRADADCLDGAADRALNDIRTDLPDVFDRAEYLSLPDALRLRILRKLLCDRGLGYDRSRLRLIEEVIQQGGGSVQLSPRLLLRAAPGQFLFTTPAGKPHRRPQVAGDEVLVRIPEVGEVVETSLFPGKILRLSTVQMKKFEKTKNFPENLLKNALDCDRIEKILTLRLCRPSDRIRIPERGLSKTMKKLWSEGRVPQDRRREQLVLCDARGVLWAEPCGADEKGRAGPESAVILTVEVVEEY